MKAHQLDGIIADCLPKLAAVMGELHPRILDAAVAAIEATQDSEDGGKPKATVSLKLVIDLNTGAPAWHVEGAVGVRYKAVSEIVQKDDEPSLPGFEPSSHPAARKLEKAIRDLAADGVTVNAQTGKGAP